MKTKIQTKIFIILFSGLFISVILSIVFQVNSYKHELNIVAENSLKMTEKSFHAILANEKQKLSLALDFLLEDSIAKNYFIKQNIDSLYDYSKPTYERIKKKYSITHLYYIMPEPKKTCFLRVHNKSKNNDVITRFTYENSVRTKSMASGLELGKTAFALRVVQPYYDNGKLIGYMEVGEEIDHFFDLLKEKTDDEFFTTVSKKFLDKKKWTEARKSNSAMSDWNDLQNMVLINSTVDIISSLNINENRRKGLYFRRISINRCWK